MGEIRVKLMIKSRHQILKIFTKNRKIYYEIGKIIPQNSRSNRIIIVTQASQITHKFQSQAISPLGFKCQHNGWIIEKNKLKIVYLYPSMVFGCR